MRFEAGAEIVRQRSAGLCEAKRPGCSGRGQETHHRQPRGMGGVHGVGAAVNRPSCLVRVCRACHHWAEMNRTEAEDLGLLVRRPTDPATVPVWLHTANGSGLFLLTDDGNYVWQDDELSA